MLIPLEHIKNIIKQFNIKITGVLHVGAHDCEELPFYNDIGVNVKDIVWLDALEDKVKQNHIRGIPNVYHAVVTDKDDAEVVFKVANNYQSSSVLDFGTHSINHPDVKFVDTIVSKTITLNTFFQRNNIDGNNYNFWNFDIQGAELLALKGATNYIKNAKMIYLEVNEREVYKDCGLITEIDQLLSEYGFIRVLTAMTPAGWGDALYIQT